MQLQARAPSWSPNKGSRSRVSTKPFIVKTAGIRAVVLGRTEVRPIDDLTDFGFNNVKYDIKLIKLFKGPKKNYNAVYTASNSAACGVNLINGTEYFMSGRLDFHGFLQVGLCGFVRPWEDMSFMQKKGVSQTYKTGCNCKITNCYSIPCGSSFAECLWPDFLMFTVFRNFACVEKSDGSCAWSSWIV
nr:metalloproteinase inhibitor 2-like [Nerophis lumbriciformis]